MRLKLFSQYYPAGLENRPEEVDKLSRYNKLFESITFPVIFSSFLFILLPTTIPHINKFSAAVIITTAAIASTYFYRILPFEKRTGKFQYSFRHKGFLIGLINPIMATAYILVTGGPFSPFWYIYILVLISAALYLPLWAAYVEIIEITLLYLAACLFVWPALFGEQQNIQTLLSMPLLNLFALYLSFYLVYRQAIELNFENVKSQVLAGNLSQTQNIATAERNKLDSIIKNIVDGIIAIDQKTTKIILVNDAAEKMLGLPKDKIMGRPVDDIIQLYDGSQKISVSIYCPISTFGQERNVYSHHRLRLESQINTNLFVNITSSTVKEIESDNIGCILILHDATKERELEEMQLDFVSIAAHELRTPLTSMRGYLALLKDEYVSKMGQEPKVYLERASISTDQLVSLVENLLSVSKIERRVLTIDLKPTDWEDNVAKIVSDFSERARQKNITVTYIAPKTTLPKVMVDQFRISEVLSNLIANAINYTNPGGKVDVEIWQEGQYIVTRVSDTGQGIPPSAIPKLFAKFFRVSGVLEQGSKGTGLGLYISKAIVDMHKGKIWVESELGKGSQFYFSIPVASQNKVEIQAGVITQNQDTTRRFIKH